MNYSMTLPVQLFRANTKSPSSFWIGSFESLQQSRIHALEIGIEHGEAVAVQSNALPGITQGEFDRQVRLIEQELTTARVALQNPSDLAAKLQIKAQVRDLEQKRSQFRLHVFSFVQ